MMKNSVHQQVTWQSYHNPHVRNLALVLSSPALLRYLPDFQQPLTVLDDAFWLKHYQTYIPKLQALDHHPQPLTDFLTQHKNHRLGYYFEYLLLFWLQDKDFHPFELIKHRATLFEGKTTIGELDFLIKNLETGKIEHWEVAIKFYLGHPPLNDALCWLGANDNDSFGRKLAHLAQKQFRYACYQEYEIDQRCLVVKGRLFYPSHYQHTNDETLDCLSAQHLRGSWWRWDEFVQSQAAAQLVWRQVDRDEWLADQQINKKLPLLTVTQLLPLTSNRAELFIGFDNDGQEQMRCFVRPTAAEKTDIL